VTEGADGNAARRPRHLHAIRGAITVERDESPALLAATRELLTEIASRNRMQPHEIVSAIFTLTPDLSSDSPALAARQLGWTDAALLCTMEIPVPRALARTIRVLIHAEFDEPRTTVAHVYLGAAVALRPDRAGPALPNA
jgi:chorismate mutase